MICTFFGHGDCYNLEMNTLKYSIEKLIDNGVDMFYVGNQGRFDYMVLACLSELKNTFPHISFSVVLAYLPKQKNKYDSYYVYSIYPDGFETIHPKFAIEKRNQWMIERADCCLCYVDRTYGGAYKFACLAKRKGLNVINLGSIKI